MGLYVKRKVIYFLFKTLSSNFLKEAKKKIEKSKKGGNKRLKQRRKEGKKGGIKIRN